MLNFRNLPKILDFDRHRSAFTVLCVLIAYGIRGRYSRNGWSLWIFHKSNGWSVGSAYWYTKEMVSEMPSTYTRCVPYRLHRIHRLISCIVIPAPGKCSFQGGLISFAQPSNCGRTWEEIRLKFIDYLIVFPPPIIKLWPRWIFGIRIHIQWPMYTLSRRPWVTFPPDSFSRIALWVVISVTP